jgi:glucose/arabinose dehydrogenase
LNATIYQVAPNGACTPFVSFAGPADSPNGIGFTPDGKHMLVSLRSGNAGSIRRVTPEGKIEPQPFAEGFDSPSGLAFAPNGFGAYGGQLFVADRGSKPSTGAAARAEPDGRIYRVTPDGQRHLVASGLYNPIGLSFFDGKLWVTDINSDYIGGRELPDGVLVEIHPR